MASKIDMKEKILGDWLYREWHNTNETYKLKLRIPTFLLTQGTSYYARFSQTTCTIEVSYTLMEKHAWPIVVQVLRHEMAHQWVSEKMRTEEGSCAEPHHGVAFQHACDLMALESWARKSAATLPGNTVGPLTSQLTAEEERLFVRAQKLLSLAQSDNAFEASLAMQRMQEMYLKYHLASIERTASPEYVSVLWVLNTKRIRSWHNLALGLLREFYFVETICVRTYQVDQLDYSQAVDLLGRRPHVLMAHYVAQFLERSIAHLWKQKKKTPDTATDCRPSPARSNRQAFEVGVITGFMRALQEQRKERVPPEQGTGLALSLCKDRDLHSWIRRRYPFLRSVGSRRSINGHSENYQAGLKAGTQLKLRPPLSESADKNPRAIEAGRAPNR